MSDETLEQPTVLVEGGPIDGHSMPITQGTALIVGSGRLAHLRLDHPAIELAHVKITWDDVGIAMVDNGSRHGTWVNGEMVETAGLLDGDVISFAPPDVQPPPPQVRVRIPKGTVPEPPPLPPEPEHAVAASAPAARAPSVGGAAARPRRGRRSRGALDFDLPSPRTVGLVAGGLALLIALGWLGSRLLGGGGAPSLSSVEPARCEAGRSVALKGSRFDTDAAGNTVWFGERSVPADSVGGGSLFVSVPAGVPPGSVPVAVETSGGRSRPVILVVLAALQAAGIEPAGALPGDAVVLRGQGFDGGEASVTVGGAAAKVLEAAPDAIRFEMPPMEAAPGSMHPVVATVGGRSTSPVEIALGRLPLVLAVDPPRAMVGDLVHIRGVGFPDDPKAVTATFGGVSALVASASSRELVVVTPVPAGAAAETPVRVRVRVGDRTSSDDVRHTLIRLTAGSYVLRFFAAAGGAPGTATVATEIAPVLLLGGKGAAASVATRAVRVATALNELLERPRGGRLVFVGYEEPEAGVGVEGAPALLVRVLAADSAAYQSPPGAPARGAPPNAAELAAWWAALLNDYVAVCTGPDPPSAVARLDPRGGGAVAELRRALPWRYRAGVANESVAGLPDGLRTRLREAALRVP